MGLKGKRARQLVADVVQNPRAHEADPIWGELARELLAAGDADRPASRSATAPGATTSTPAPTSRCGPPARCRMRSAAALMPDAHVGYGLPIGGVLACENAVIPYAVGVDIACRMKLSVLDLPVESLDKRVQPLQGSAQRRHAVRRRRRASSRPRSHAVMDRDWNVTRITRERKDTAWKQLGTSGSGNHFVEFGVLTLAARRQAARPRQPASTSRC